MPYYKDEMGLRISKKKSMDIRVKKREQMIIGLDYNELIHLFNVITKKKKLRDDFTLNENNHLSELSIYNNKIDGFTKTLKLNLSENLQILAQEQMNEVISEKSILKQNFETINLKYKENILEANNLFPRYDWTFDMKSLVIQRINFFEKELIEQNKKVFVDKQQYIITKCIPYLLGSWDYCEIIDFSRLSDDYYLDELVNDTHIFHYRHICTHAEIDFLKKKYSNGLSQNLLKFNNIENFNLDSMKCLCTETL